MRYYAHGLRAHPLYQCWYNIIRRCERPNTPRYPDHGGRGIKVCERWKDVANFIADMYPSYKPGLQIDRINNDGDYTPKNCRWATPKEQARNRRSSNLITYKGRTLCDVEWSEITGLHRHVIRRRIDKGWSVEKALNTAPANRGQPVKPRRSV